MTPDEIKKAARLVLQRTRNAPVDDPAILSKVAALIAGGETSDRSGK
jgi:hypothetical protein